jgi:hypothetical protein
MHLNIRRCFTLLSLAAILVGLLPIASAQDESPTEEEQALIEQLITAIDGVRDYESFMLTITAADSQQQIVTQDGAEARNIKTEVTSDNTFWIIRDDNPSGRYVSTKTLSRDSLLEIDDGSVTMEAEFLYVDGILYGTFEVIEGESIIPPLPEMTAISDPETNPLTTTFTTDSLEVLVLGEPEEDNLFSSVELLTENFTSLVLSEEEVDGETVAVITVRFEDADFGALLANSELDAALINNLEEGSFTEIAATFNAAGELLRLYTETQYAVIDLPFSVVDPTQPDTLIVSLIVSSSENQIYSHINEDLEPIAAPE